MSTSETELGEPQEPPGGAEQQRTSQDLPDAEVRQGIRDKYLKALEMVWRKPTNCPVCDSTSWAIGDLVDAPLRQLDGVARWPSPVYVYLPVTCDYCGFTHFFHSGVLDVRLSEEIKAVPPFRRVEQAQ